ncbi:MAG: succinylglutamate desuccinylase/aspartoacylase family protein [Polyangiaceae bacterium]
MSSPKPSSRPSQRGRRPSSAGIPAASESGRASITSGNPAPVIQVAPEPPSPLFRERLLLEEIPEGVVTRLGITMVRDGLGMPVVVPVLVARGRREGPVLGITAAVHGNELNGIRVIHDLFERIDVATLRGTVVGVAAVNVPGLHNHQRHFVDGRDLNHLFPGDPNGDVARVYAHRIVDRIVSRFDYLVDLHTASFGRINSLYVRADMKDPRCARMAYLQRPQIIVHNPASDRTLRGTAMELGIPAITVEIGDPQRFQPSYIKTCRIGIRSLLADTQMLPQRAVRERPEPVICSKSYWLYTDRGGLLEVLPEATDRVAKGEEIAILRNAYGDVVRRYAAPQAGVVVGKSVNPVGQSGARILHLGVVAPADNAYQKRQPLSGGPTE